MEKYLKEKLIASYSQILNKYTESILSIIAEHREYLKIILDNIPSINSDVVLNEINNQINLVLGSLSEYENNMNEFKISDDVIEYLNNYSNTEISPSYKKFEIHLNHIYKDVIINNLDINSEDYKNSYNYKKFIDIKDTIFNEIKDKYINKINESIIFYYENYTKKLEQKINTLNLRRLHDYKGNFDRKISDKSLDEIFHKLLESSQQTKTFIHSLDFSMNSFNFF